MTKEVLLQEFHLEKAISMVPVLVIMSIFLIIGLPGNIMVFLYYGFKAKRTTNTVFISAMAMYDIVCFSFALPLHLYDFGNLYNYRVGGLCKFMMFITRLTTLGSAFTLFIIAVDRFRRICLPFKSQFTMREAKISCVVVLITSLLFSWPTFMIYDAVSITLKGTNLIGSDCSPVRTQSYKMFTKIYGGVLLALFLFIMTVLCVVYTMIGRVIWKTKRTRKSYSTHQLSSESGLTSTVTENVSNIPKTGTLSETDFEKKDVKDTCEFTKGSNSLAPSNGIQRSQMQRTVQPRANVKNSKFTILMLVISVLFIVSFLPYCILLIWRGTIHGHEEDNLSKNGIAIFNFFLRSYFINSALNPFTYGIFNSKFKQFFLNIFSCCRNKTPITTSSNSDSGQS